MRTKLNCSELHQRLFALVVFTLLFPLFFLVLLTIIFFKIRPIMIKSSFGNAFRFNLGLDSKIGRIILMLNIHLVPCLLSLICGHITLRQLFYIFNQEIINTSSKNFNLLQLFLILSICLIILLIIIFDH